LASLHELNDALVGGEVDTLIIVGGNPVFSAPADFNFRDSLARVKFRVHLSPDVNETSRLCDWHIPENHFLESWGDARAFDGTISIIQPLIMPLYAGKSAHELLEAMVNVSGRTDYDIVHDFWSSNNPGAVFYERWRRTLHDGLIQDSAFPAKTVSLRPFEIPTFARISDILEITFQPDPTIWDGRYANNGWLQELPKPVTKLVWDNVAHISPSLAAREKLSNGDVIEINALGRTLTAPVWIVPGQPQNTIGLQFGYGRASAGSVGEKTGCNVYGLRTSDFQWAVAVTILKKTHRSYPLATTQDQHVIDSEDRQIIREGTFAEFQSHPDFVSKTSEEPSETLFNPDEYKYDGYRWGMAIDLSACTGCSACILACQSENNIPVVGKTEVARGRAMHWIRVDSYFRGAPENPEITHQPVPCMQCENAPCELVCPVGATLHDKEGLNVQVYNRCVGTRYCSNNCPYKVRRFNFFQYADYTTPSLKPMWNPNVTVRWRGVMEKCTYCIQRISAARIDSEEKGTKIADGQIRTACQQACPAQAIVFGNLSDPNSAVSKIKSHQLNFLMLGQLNTRPRTTYLAKMRNPNPALSS
jgi:Fe-S-cluster-containing dehydrogenase component